jgi:radical S-adenosyl methionine domain-containing protein 2
MSIVAKVLLLALFVTASHGLLPVIPLSVNFHFTRKCNYNCGFCFHTSLTSHVESLESAKRMLKELSQHGAKKINFAGGEPFLPEYQSKLGEMLRYAKQECGYESTSVISNSVFITPEWFDTYSEWLDILGVSCDSSDDALNQKMGRGNGVHTQHVRRAAALAAQHGVMFKLNTVVTSQNWQHDMSAFVQELQPVRWKIFQALAIAGENQGGGALRDISDLLVTPDKFDHFVKRHLSLNGLKDIIKKESNDVMRNSYFLIDEYGRFLDCSGGAKAPTQSILDVGVSAALAQLLGDGEGFDEGAFKTREGQFDWTKPSRD